MLKSSVGSSWNHCAEPVPPVGWSVMRCAPPSPRRRPRAIARRISLLRVVLDGPVAAEDPDEARVPVAPAEPLAVRLGVRGCEDLRTLAPLLVPLVAPGRQEADQQPAAVRGGDDVVDVVPVVVRRALLHVGPRRVVVDERRVAVGVRGVEAVELRERDRLDHRVALGGAIVEIALGLLAVQPVEQLPRRVAEPEEGLAVGGHEEAVVRADLQHGRSGGRGCGEGQRRGDDRRAREPGG